MKIVTTRAISFVRDGGVPEGKTEGNANLVTVSPGQVTIVPNWVSETSTFRYGIEHKTISVKESRE